MSDALAYGEQVADDTRKTQEDPPKTLTGTAAASFWSEQLAVAIREHKPYWAEAAEVLELYKNSKKTKDSRRRRMNILYANTETLRGAIYARSGKPDVRQRWSSNDQIGRTSAEIIERCVSTSLDTRAHENAVKGAVIRSILTGRGVVRLSYEPDIKETDEPAEDELLESPEAKATEPIETGTITGQTVKRKLVHTSDFLHNPARDWSEVWWVGFRHRMTRADLVENDFTDAATIPLTWVPTGDNGRPDPNATDSVKRAEVWEIWSLTHLKRFWIVPNHKMVCRIDDDPYGIEGFWPMPQPLTMTEELENVIPALDYYQYQQLAEDLEEVNNRIARLTKAMKLRGVRDASIKGLERLAKANDDEFVPIENYAHLVQKGGLEGAFQTFSIKEQAEVLVRLHESAAKIEEKIDKLTGIADIMRGGSDGPSKTATEQNIKSQYGGIRIKDRQRSVQVFIRDLMRLEAELICEHFEPAVLQEMTGIQITPEIMQLLRSQKTRAFRIDIETDSTVYDDAEANKQATSETVTALTGLLQQGLPMMQAAPEMTEVIFEAVGVLMRSMKGGRSLEDTIDRARQQMQQRLAQPPPPQANPEQIKAEAAMQQQAAKAQADAQAAEAQRMHDQMAEDAKARTAIEVARVTGDAAKEMKLMELAEAARVADAKLELEHIKAAAEHGHRRDEIALRRDEIALKQHTEHTRIANDNANKGADREQKGAMHNDHMDEAEAAREAAAESAKTEAAE